MDFQKLWNCGSLFGIHTSAILVNQWPPNRIFCLLLNGNSEICITFLIFHRAWCLTTAVFFLSKKTNNISVVSSHFHLSLRISALRLPTVTQGVSYNLTKSRQQNHSPAYCSNSGPRPRHSSPKCGWRHKNDFYSDGKCPLDGTWCQRNNCQSSHKGEITPEETDR